MCLSGNEAFETVLFCIVLYGHSRRSLLILITLKTEVNTFVQ